MDTVSVQHPFIEVSVNSVLDYANGNNIREYSNQYRKVVIRHDNSFRVTELRLVGFIEPDYTVIIAQGTFDYYRIVPDDEDDAMADFTHIRLGAPEAIDKSRERMLEELRTDAGTLPEDKVSHLVRTAVAEGMPQAALGEEFRYDYCISSLEKYYHSLIPANRVRFIEFLKSNESSLTDLLREPEFSAMISGVMELTTAFSKVHIPAADPGRHEHGRPPAIVDVVPETPEKDTRPLQQPPTSPLTSAKHLFTSFMHHEKKTMPQKTAPKKMPEKEEFDKFVKQMELASKRMRGKR
ncbi:MAG: hypothetical protein AABZ39_09170 [Spirochaetota bacterium]